MKLEHYLTIVILAGIVAYYNYFPKVETKTEYVKGDTITITETKIVKVPTIIYEAETDTFIVNDTIYQGYSSNFRIGNQLSFVTGNVAYYNQKFEFSNVEIKYPQITKTVTDTIKFTKYLDKKGFLHGISVGFGYGMINGKFDVYVGYGVQFRF